MTIAELLALAISQTTFTLLIPAPPNPYYPSAPYRPHSINTNAPTLFITPIKNLVEVCCTLGRQELLGNILDNMINGLVNPQNLEMRRQIVEVVLSMLEFLESKIEGADQENLAPSLGNLVILVLELTLVASDLKVTLCKSNIKFLFQFAATHLGPEFFFTR